MRVSSKPVSSPGRAENYPPLLMRFLRSNVGSKSRGRSRSSPMFVRRKNAAAAAAVETQEPSSPKVTCMGQVRMTRSQKSNPRPSRNEEPPPDIRRRFKWVRNALFCHPFDGKLKTKSFSPNWRKWVSFSRVSFQRKSEKTPNSSKSEPIFRRSVREDEQESKKEEQEDDEEGQQANSFVSPASTPPKNALLLTRCRSAPYRSSSLASRFWGSPVSAGDESKDETEQSPSREEEDNNSASKRESLSEESNQECQKDAETERIEGLSKEIEDSIQEREKNCENVTEECKKELFLSPRRRLLLRRCKSEPARTRERLDPDVSFWKKRRPGFT